MVGLAIHSIFDVIFGNRWWISEGVVSEVFWQDSFWFCSASYLSLPYTKLFKLNIADTALVMAIFELVWLGKTKFSSQKIMAYVIFWITRQIVVLLFC